MSMQELLEQENIILPPSQAINIDLRKAILAIEAKIKSMPGALGEDPFPLKHIFAEGLYIREITIPQGFLVVGKLHKDSYFNCIISGEISVLTEEGVKRISGPCWVVSPPGTKRFGYVHKESKWVTVHPNPTNSRDIRLLESKIHLESYDLLPEIIDVEKCEELDYFLREVKNIEDFVYDSSRFRELTRIIFSHEKDGFFSDWTKEQQDLYMSGDWEAFSRSRGYTEEEIYDLKLWIFIKEQAEKQGLSPLDDIRDLSMETAIKNIHKDKNGEILLSSHIPSSKKEPYKNGEDLCLV